MKSYYDKRLDSSTVGLGRAWLPLSLIGCFPFREQEKSSSAHPGINLKGCRLSLQVCLVQVAPVPAMRQIFQLTVAILAELGNKACLNGLNDL